LDFIANEYSRRVLTSGSYDAIQIQSESSLPAGKQSFPILRLAAPSNDQYSRREKPRQPGATCLQVLSEPFTHHTFSSLGFGNDAARAHGGVAISTYLEGTSHRPPPHERRRIF
jgi:hypothetical protein